jgi:hypothetical protein
VQQSSSTSQLVRQLQHCSSTPAGAKSIRHMPHHTCHVFLVTRPHKCVFCIPYSLRQRGPGHAFEAEPP